MTYFNTPTGLTKEGRANFNLNYAMVDSYIIIESMPDEEPLRSDDGEHIREGDYAFIGAWFNSKLPCRRIYHVTTKRQTEDGEQGDTTLTPSQFRIVTKEEWDNAKS